ncbi:tryptophan halogenase family protein [Cellvibrio sp. OA-2007]|uniref:tryptophan halogenase family protein n=1 Tax=Cellvibrio sp. OA-2007 TaxID=529823 RepID=UPI0007838DAD|nr:tryptophan halogenase family protein [Cellvibrio sp. OA-2007]
MQEEQIKQIVIIGGGTSGWMTAAALAHFLKNKSYAITLIESEAIGTVGVGEATLPHLRFFNQTLGIDEAEFMAATNATYKMGIEFSNWGKMGDAYIHPFGEYGREINGVAFHHYWLRQHFQGLGKSIDYYSLPVVAAAQQKFMFPMSDERSVFSTYSYAFHIDAGMYASYLRKYSENLGVVREEGKVVAVNQRDNGEISSVQLETGAVIGGDFFIDCSGFRGVLIEQTLKTGYENWSHWLPCNRAVAAPSELDGALLPYTKAIAQVAGWRWRIPLRHRTGNGHVYCSEFITDQDACDTLMSNIDGKLIADPKFLQFTTGKRKKAWNKNCVAIGLSGGFLEPLESTSIYLIQIAIMKLIEFFPDKKFDLAGVDEFNRLMDMEYLRVRDFLILHYHATQRNDAPFWDYCRNMSIPDELAHKMALFRERGHVVEYQGGLFLEPSWVAVYLGQGVVPSAYDPRVNWMTNSQLEKTMLEIEALIDRAAMQMPAHHVFLEQHQAKTNGRPRALMSLYGGRQ